MSFSRVINMVFATLMAYCLKSQTIAAGNEVSYALCKATAWSWGWENHGSLGQGTLSASYNLPGMIQGVTGITSIDVGLSYVNAGHGMVLKGDSTVWTWGSNFDGQLGNGTNVDSDVAIQVVGLTGIVSIAAGGSFCLALKRNGTLWAWGKNFYAGNNVSSSVPVQVIFPPFTTTSITAIAAGERHCMIIKSDSTVWCWGEGTFGQIGNGNNAGSSVPVQVAGLSGVVSIAAGSYHSLAVKSDGTVWAWGDNGYGELGNGVNIGVSLVPVQVAVLTNARIVSAGRGSSLALRNDGTVWSWGGNSFGQLGSGNTIDSNVPLLINGLLNIKEINGGQYHHLALQNDGTLWAFGYNGFGCLGNGTNETYRSIPSKVVGLCNYTGLTSTNPASDLHFSIYPNPSSGSFVFRLSTPGSLERVEIFNALGQTIYSHAINSPSQEVTIEKLPKGLYFCSVVFFDGSREIQKCIVD